MVAVVIDHRRAVTRGVEHAVDDPAHAAPPGDDDRVLLLDRIGLAPALPCAIGMRDQLVVEDEQQRRHQHGQRHDEQELRSELRREDRIGDTEGDEDKSEFARLRKAEAEQP